MDNTIQNTTLELKVKKNFQGFKLYMNSNFKFIPSPYEGGQITDSKPGQKFEDKFDIFFFDPPFSAFNFLENLKTLRNIKIFKKEHILIIVNGFRRFLTIAIFQCCLLTSFSLPNDQIPI